MTIAYVLKMYPRFSETFILNEVLELERQGVDIEIYSLHKPNDGRFHADLARVRAPVTYLPEYLFAEPGRVLAANFAMWRAHPQRYTRVLLYALTSHNPLKSLQRFLKAAVLANHLRAQPVAHLHAHFASSPTRVAMFASMLTDIPFSFTAHAKDIFLKDVDCDLLRDKIRAAKFVITVSDFNREFLARLVSQKYFSCLGGLIPPACAAAGRIRRLYNGINLSQFDGHRNYVPQSAREPLILAVGRLVEKKGFDVLIRACARLRDRRIALRCEIIGKGPEEAKLRALIQELGMRNAITLVGPKPQDQVVDAYRRAAVFTLPCVISADGNRDGLPTVLLEAMAMRVAAISTDVTGVPEIIDDGVSGLIVPQNDATALANALARLLGDAALRERMGIAARVAVEQKFDLTQNVATLREWLTGTTVVESASADGVRARIANQQSASV